jgi:hypothetical protein
VVQVIGQEACRQGDVLRTVDIAFCIRHHSSPTQEERIVLDYKTCKHLLGIVEIVLERKPIGFVLMVNGSALWQIDYDPQDQVEYKEYYDAPDTDVKTKSRNGEQSSH